MRLLATRSLSRVVAPLISLSCALAGCAVEEPIVGTGSAVVNGTTTTDFLEVVAVARVMGDSGALCTGTAIGDYAVLTAKHCVFDEGAAGWTAVSPTSMFVLVGSDIERFEDILYVREIRTTPGSDVDADIEAGNDVAVLLLGERAPLANRGPLTDTPVVGAPVRLIGFGRTMPGTPVEGDSGVKHTGMARVNRFGSRLVETTGSSWTCQGDSGGGLLDAASGHIIGVTSFGPGGCTFSNSYFSRVTTHASFIEPLRSFMPPCTPEPETCGDGVDNDCNGMADEGCTALGDPCTRPDECADGTCELVGSGMVCVRECDPREAIPRCPFGFLCEETGCGTGRCVVGAGGPLEDGAVCSTDLECGSGRCGEVGGVSRCGRQCALDGAPCPDGTLCETGGAACGTCIPYDLATGPRPFGAPCEAPADCMSMMCTEGICTRACSFSMPCPDSRHHCRGGLCVPGALGDSGSPCVTGEDCGMAAPECVDADGDLLCAAMCPSDGSECSLGLVCGPTSGGDRCVPPGLPLGSVCATNEECRTGICAGVCTRLCDGGATCPAGYECRPAGTHSGCFVPETGGGGGGGGCAAGGGAPAGGLLLLLPLLALPALRRRR